MESRVSIAHTEVASLKEQNKYQDQEIEAL